MSDIRNIAILMTPDRNPEITQFTGVIRLASVLSAVAERIFIITGNFPITPEQKNIHVIDIPSQKTSKSKESLYSGVVRVLIAQLTLSYALLRLAPKLSGGADRVIIFRPVTILLPTLIARVLGIKIITIPTGHSEKVWDLRKDSFAWLLARIRRINLKLSYKVIVYHDNLVDEWNLKPYQDKIVVAPYLYIDLKEFKFTKPLDTRGNNIGYIGRLDREKGIMNFIEAIPILRNTDDIKVTIIGDGEQINEIRQYIKDNKLDNISLTGWIAHNLMSQYLNELKLLILPSYTEGLPNVVLEAMACGTPVLTTLVGAIPAIIIDGQTGFILEDNSPETISRNIVRALKFPLLAEVVKNARSLIENKYSYSATIERYKDIL